jgi:hypothetical protein
MMADAWPDTILKGVHFYRPFKYKDGDGVGVDITSYKFHLTLVPLDGKTGAQIDLTSENGGIVKLNQTTNRGEGYIIILPAVTGAIAWVEGKGDLLMLDGNNRSSCLARGTFGTEELSTKNTW